MCIFLWSLVSISRSIQSAFICNKEYGNNDNGSNNNDHYNNAYYNNGINAGANNDNGGDDNSHNSVILDL